MKVVNDLLGISNMKIVQDLDWFAFSLDSVLLAQFASVHLRDKKILDLCSGNAPIPLILSTRTKASITAVEIQPDICELAKESIQLNHKESQIELLCMDLRAIKNYFESDTFDLITMNPPYFKVGEKSVKNEDSHKTIARHEVAMTLEDSFLTISKVLKNNGRFAMVHRTDRFVEILFLLKKYHLEPKRVQFIYPKEKSESNLFLIESIKNGKTGLKLLPPCIVHEENGEYRKEILDLFEKS